MSNSRRPKQPHPGGQGTASKATPVIVALAVLVCIAAVVAITLVLGGNGDNGADGASSATPTEASTIAEGVSCTAPPAPPAAPDTFEQAPDPTLAEGATWVATLSTNCGDITLQLDGAKAPQTVASFLFLADQGFFDDGPCHRLTTEGIFVLQCGDPTGSGQGNPGYGFGVENAPADGGYPAGSLAMARSNDPNSNGSQFFLVYQDSTISDPTGYSIFGTITQGLDIVSAIAQQGVSGGGGDGPPAQPVSILSVSVEKQ